MKRRDRRAFLGGAAAGLLAAPGFIARAFAAGRCEPAGKLLGLRALSAQWRHARETHRPLLAIIIPTGTTARRQRGAAWGELLNGGTDHQLAPLAGVEVVCAKLEDLRLLVPAVGAGDPLCVLLDPASQPVTVRRASVPAGVDLYPWQVANEQLRAAEPRRERDRFMGRDVGGAMDRVVDARIAVMAGVVASLVGGAPADVTRAAADVRARIVKPPVPGARWALSGGCGISYETPEPSDDAYGVACGMGHVPAKSMRFLFFFANFRSELGAGE